MGRRSFRGVTKISNSLSVNELFRELKRYFAPGISANPGSPVIVLVSSLSSNPLTIEVSSCLSRTVCVSVRLLITGIPFTLLPASALMSNSSCSVTCLSSCTVGVALIFNPMS